MSTHEEQVTQASAETTTAAPSPTGAAAFDAARASLAQSSKDQSAETKTEDHSSPPPQTAEPTAKAADQTDEPAESQDTLLSADEVAKLSPKERTAYQKLQAHYTQKTQALAAERKAMEQWKPLITGLETNPSQTLELVAQQLGLSVVKPDPQKAVASEVEAALADLPPELDVFRPVLESFGQKLLSNIKSEIAPIREQTSKMASEAAAAETAATLEAFGAKHPDWKQFEPKMVELAKKFQPTPGAMTDGEFLETMYQLATAGRSEADKTKQIVERINKSVAGSEEKTSGVANERVEVVMPESVRKDPSSRFRAAFEAAKRGERWSS